MERNLDAAVCGKHRVRDDLRARRRVDRIGVEGLLVVIRRAERSDWCSRSRRNGRLGRFFPAEQSVRAVYFHGSAALVLNDRRVAAPDRQRTVADLFSLLFDPIGESAADVQRMALIRHVERFQQFVFRQTIDRQRVAFMVGKSKVVFVGIYDRVRGLASGQDRMSASRNGYGCAGAQSLVVRGRLTGSVVDSHVILAVNAQTRRTARGVDGFHAFAIRQRLDQQVVALRDAERFCRCEYRDRNRVRIRDHEAFGRIEAPILIHYTATGRTNQRTRCVISFVGVFIADFDREITRRNIAQRVAFADCKYFSGNRFAFCRIRDIRVVRTGNRNRTGRCRGKDDTISFIGHTGRIHVYVVFFDFAFVIEQCVIIDAFRLQTHIRTAVLNVSRCLARI